MHQTKFDVFISYSRKDYVDDNKNVIPDNEVSRIKDALIKAGISFWFDEDGICPGDSFTEKIVTNIEASRILVYLSTANANSSHWTSKEIACAHEMQKYIIPVRIDSTPYNKNVLFRIADLSYVDYQANPQKGLDELVASVKTYLEQIQTEEEKRKREQEALLYAQEQEQLVNEITLTCKKLNNDEEKIELERENLLLRVKKITDAKQQTELKALIRDCSPIRNKYQMLEPQTVEKEDGVLVFLTIEGSFHEEIEVRVSDQLKTIRNQIKSIVFKFGLPFVDNNGYPIQYILTRAYDDVEKPEILDFVDEDGRELCMLDYNIQQGDHLRLITVPKTVKSGWFLSLAILFVTASPLIGMLFFNRNVFFDNTGIQLAVAFSIVSVLGVLYLNNYSSKATNKQWTIIRSLVTVAYIINTMSLFLWEDYFAAPYLVLSVGLSVLTSFTFLVKINKTQRFLD